MTSTTPMTSDAVELGARKLLIDGKVNVYHADESTLRATVIAADRQYPYVVTAALTRHDGVQWNCQCRATVTCKHIVACTLIWRR